MCFLQGGGHGILLLSQLMNNQTHTCQGLSSPKLLVLRLLWLEVSSGDPTQAWDRPVGIL